MKRGSNFIFVPVVTLVSLLSLDGTAQQAETGTRPGVLRRPTTQDAAAPAVEPAGTDVAPTPTPTTAQAPAPTQAAPPVAPTAPPAGGAGATRPATGAASGPQRAADGTPILNVPDLDPDLSAIPGNFEEGFDPFDPPSNAKVNVDFRDAELNDVVMWISALTGKNFLVADTINASKKITIISPQPVSIAEAYRAFLAALNMNGLTVVPFGRFLKIVEASTSMRQAMEATDDRRDIPDDDRMVTHILQLENIGIATIQPVIEAMKTEPASMVPYEPTNTIIISESAANLRKILEIVDRLDVPGGQEQIYLYPVQYASAEDLKGLIEEIFKQDEQQARATEEAPRRRSSRRSSEEAAAADAAATTTTSSAGDETNPASVRISKIIADERTNQLIIIANDRSYRRMLDVLAQLDVPIPGEGQIHVLFLENADATELASTLQSLTQSVEDQRGEAASARARAAEAAGGGGAQAASAAVGAISATFSGEISITSDEATNSLVVVASLRDFLALKNVVSQLDRRRQQVYVEAVIMEVTVNRQNQFGIALNGGALPEIGGEDVPVFAATSVGGLSSIALDPSSLLGLGAVVRGPEIEGSADVIGLSIPSIGAVLQALQTDNDVNVLSTPHILTMDNEEAEIVVGENVPFISGISGGSGLGSLGSLAGLAGGDASSLAGLSGFGIPSVSVQRQDVALTLRITPQINESNFVRLEIEEEVEDVQSIDPVLGPRTTTRQLRTTVVVQDQQTIVIGGLLRDTTTRDDSKIPVLGDIPIVGRLFRHSSTRKVKTNLLLLLTPYIIRDTEDFQTIFERKMEEREEFISYFGRRDTEFVQAVDYSRKDGAMQTLFETISEARALEEARRAAFGETTSEAPLPVQEPIRVEIPAPAPQP